MITVNEKLFWLAYNEGMGTDKLDLVEQLSTTQKKWLNENLTNETFRQFIAKYPFIDDVQLCANNFYGPRNIIKWTEEYDSIKKEYIIIGSSSNGDFIAIPRNSWESIGYISHEEFGYDKNGLVNYCPVSRSSIGEFFYNTWHVDNYPVDYYEAVKSSK